ncbi:unnamed protein product [Calypogeia fissa]
MEVRQAVEGECQGGDMNIPGLFNDVVLEHVATKVSWGSLRALACVNRPWKRAIEEREVHNDRKRTRSCQTLLLLESFSLRNEKPTSSLTSAVLCKFRELQPVLYDLEQQLMHQLPQAPPVGQELISRSEPKHVMLDEKLYILKHYVYGSRKEYVSAVHAYVLDLAACHRSWKPCSAPTVHPSTQLCVPCNGKLYAFSDFSNVVNGEVYDPKKDEWSVIVDKLHIGRQYCWYGSSCVACLNEEIFIPLEPQRRFRRRPGEKTMAVFNSSTEEWRVVQDTSLGKPALFVVDGRLYNLSNRSLDLYDPSSNSWSIFQPVQFDRFHGADRVFSWGNELLVLTRYLACESGKFPNRRSLSVGLSDLVCADNLWCGRFCLVKISLNVSRRRAISSG